MESVKPAYSVCYYRLIKPAVILLFENLALGELSAMWLELRFPTFRTIVAPSSSKGVQEGSTNLLNIEHGVVSQGTSKLCSTTVITWYEAKHVSL
jgi:hypothetical protein